MRNDQMGRVLCLMALLVVATNVIAADRVFVERFTSQEPGERWTIESTLQPPGLRWYEKGERAGFHFKSVAVPKYMKSHGYAWTEWRVGTRAFEAKWSIHVQRGLQQAWFHPGVVVALTSAPPGKMGKDDIAVAFGMIMGGPIAVVRRGGLYEFRKKDGKTVYSQFGDNRLSGLRLPGGGRVASAEWPSKRLDAANLTYRLRRNEKNVLKFELIYHGLPAGRGNPYWSGRWTMPEKVAGVPLRYIVVKRMPVKSTHVSYPGFVMRGVVHDMQARFLTASPAPVVNKAVPDRAIVLDDVIPPQNKPGKITAQYQTAWKPSLTRGGMDTGMRITGQNGALLVQTCGHALDLTKKDRKFTSGWHWAKIDESGPGDWHTVSGQYRADPARPLITVLWPVKKQDKTPSLECKYKKDLISVSPGGQDSVRFVREDGEWKWEGP